MSLTWAVQTHLSDSDTLKMVEACKAAGSPVIQVDDLTKISEIPNDVPTVFYGSIGLTRPAHALEKWHPGVVLNANFNSENWLRSNRWGAYCLNYDSSSCTAQEFYDSVHEPDEKLFVRPCNDNKAFTGAVVTYKEFCDFAISMSLIDDKFMETRITVSSPKVVTEEWRLFIVGYKVSTGSLYQRGGVAKQEPVPEEVVKFGEEIAQVYTPAPVFTLDVGRSNGELYVVETGCFNSAGLYGSDTAKLVRDVNAYYALGRPD